jgi:hypothetical protein
LTADQISSGLGKVCAHAVVKHMIVDQHLVLYGDAKARRTGAWKSSSEASCDAALQKACNLLRAGYIVFAIEHGGHVLFEEAQILEHCHPEMFKSWSRKAGKGG